MARRLSKLIVIGLAALMVAGCEASIPKEALQLTPDSLARRQVQTRVFETTNEAELLAASAHLLQDLGFNLDESEVELGVVVASKDRDATEAGQVAASLLLALLGVAMPWDDEQKIRASIITRELKERNGYAVRLTMQRIVWNTQNQISKTEPLDDPKMYQEFFAKLSKAVFLEAQEL
ncbi:MAG: hypothetical protein V3S23_08085 [Kiloniellales bacterium]